MSPKPRKFQCSSACSSSPSFTCPVSKELPRRLARTLVSNSGHPLHKPYPRGAPETADDILFGILNDGKFSSHALVAADDILCSLFNDPRNRLQIRRIASRRLHIKDSSILKESFRTALTSKVDIDYPTRQADMFANRMRAHRIGNGDDEVNALSNLALRYSRLKYSHLVRVSHLILNDRVEARIVSNTHIPAGTLMLELGGLMSADAIEAQTKGGGHGALNARKCTDPSASLFAMFSVIWRTSEQCGPGPKKDRLLLGPMRFVNHSCTPNSKLIPFPKTNAWGAETSKDVSDGEEITVSYGNYYFAPGECACASCVPQQGDASPYATPTTSLASSPAFPP